MFHYLSTEDSSRSSSSEDDDDGEPGGSDDEELDEGFETEQSYHSVINKDTIHRNDFINADDDDDEIKVVDSKPAAKPNVTVKPVPSVVTARTPSVARSRAAALDSLLERPAYSCCWTPIHLKTRYVDWSDRKHQVVVILLPSGVSQKAAEDFTMGLQIHGDDYYLYMEVDWPTTMCADFGLRFLNAIKNRRLLKVLSKKIGFGLSEAEIRRQFDSSWVMMEMAIKGELNDKKDRGWQRSKTHIKLDFAVEYLSQDCWELLGDPDTGVRMLVVDMEEASPVDDVTPTYGRRVEMMASLKTEGDD